MVILIIESMIIVSSRNCTRWHSAALTIRSSRSGTSSNSSHWFSKFIYSCCCASWSWVTLSITAVRMARWTWMSISILIQKRISLCVRSRVTMSTMSTWIWSRFRKSTISIIFCLGIRICVSVITTINFCFGIRCRFTKTIIKSYFCVCIGITWRASAAIISVLINYSFIIILLIL